MPMRSIMLAAALMAVLFLPEVVEAFHHHRAARQARSQEGGRPGLIARVKARCHR
jgi:hypothetical protein